MMKTNTRNSFFDLSLVALIWIVLLFQRMAINISNFQFSIGLIILYVFLALWIMRGEIVVNKKRLLYFLIVLSGISLSVLISSTYSDLFSIGSLLLLLGLYFPTIFTFKAGKQLIALKGFQATVLIFAVIGVTQFLLQFVGVPFRDWLSFIPTENIIYNYNYTIPISFGSSIYKANGVFPAEPSFFSQLVALSILIEIYVFQKYQRLLILLPALLLSFSGTGLILLAVGLLPLLFTLKWDKLLIIGTVMLITLSVFFYTGFASHTFNRIRELQDPNASGYIRFVSPYISYVQFFNDQGNTPAFWFGMGPGVSDDVMWNTITYLNPLMKLLIEYGLPGLLFFLYLIYIFFSGQSLWLALALFTVYAVLSGGLLTPQFTVLHFLVLVFHQKPMRVSLPQVFNKL
jgi:hypothetical protein